VLTTITVNTQPSATNRPSLASTSGTNLDGTYTYASPGFWTPEAEPRFRRFARSDLGDRSGPRFGGRCRSSQVWTSIDPSARTSCLIRALAQRLLAPDARCGEERGATQRESSRLLLSGEEILICGLAPARGCGENERRRRGASRDWRGARRGPCWGSGPASALRRLARAAQPLLGSDPRARFAEPGRYSWALVAASSRAASSCSRSATGSPISSAAPGVG
jgi:hypothetical protein